MGSSCDKMFYIEVVSISWIKINFIIVWRMIVHMSSCASERVRSFRSLDRPHVQLYIWTGAFIQFTWPTTCPAVHLNGCVHSVHLSDHISSCTSERVRSFRSLDRPHVQLYIWIGAFNPFTWPTTCPAVHLNGCVHSVYLTDHMSSVFIWTGAFTLFAGPFTCRNLRLFMLGPFTGISLGSSNLSVDHEKITQMKAFAPRQY